MFQIFFREQIIKAIALACLTLPLLVYADSGMSDLDRGFPTDMKAVTGAPVAPLPTVSNHGRKIYFIFGAAFRPGNHFSVGGRPLYFSGRNIETNVPAKAYECAVMQSQILKSELSNRSLQKEIKRRNINTIQIVTRTGPYLSHQPPVCVPYLAFTNTVFEVSACYEEDFWAGPEHVKKCVLANKKMIEGYAADWAKVDAHSAELGHELRSAANELMEKFNF